jgi:hypothetical protein
MTGAMSASSRTHPNLRRVATSRTANRGFPEHERALSYAESHNFDYGRNLLLQGERGSARSGGFTVESPPGCNFCRMIVGEVRVSQPAQVVG